jgi:hypothetical protein
MPGWLIPLALAGGSALANLFGAKKQAGAAKEAAKTQAAAAEQARLLQQQMYQQTRADLSPYMQGGSQGLSSLTSLLGVGGVAPSSGLAPMAPPAAPGQARTPTPGAVYTGHQAVPRGSVPQSAYGAAPGGTVLLRAPTGQIQPVPADQAEFFLARGATRV